MTNNELNNESSSENQESLATSDAESTKNTLVYAEEELLTPSNHTIHVDSIELTEDIFEEKTAGFWMRFWAFSLDSLLVTAIIGIVANPIFYIMDWNLSDLSWYAPISIISAVIYYAYFVLMTYYFNQTVGKMIFGLRVTTLNGEKLTFTTVLIREWVGRLISNVIAPLYLLVVFLEKNQSLHDYFADTQVVHENVYVKQTKKVHSHASKALTSTN